MQAATKDDGGNSGGNSDKPATLHELLDDLVENTDGDKTTVGELLDALRQRTFGPLLLIPAIIAVAPTGAIPGMSIVTGTMILLVSMQMLVGHEHVWLPDRVLSFEMSRGTLKNATAKAKPWAKWLESYLGQRWSILVEPPATYALAAVCALLAVSMFPLALLPFAVAVPGAAIALIALGLTLKDGILVCGGYAFAAVTVALVYYAVS